MNDTKSDSLTPSKPDFKKILSTVDKEAGAALGQLVEAALLGFEANVNVSTLTDVEKAKQLKTIQKYIVASVVTLTAKAMNEKTGLSFYKMGRASSRACNKLGYAQAAAEALTNPVSNEDGEEQDEEPSEENETGDDDSMN